MKQACFGWFWPSLMKRWHLPTIVAVGTRWSSQKVRGQRMQRKSKPPAAPALRPQVRHEWCGQPHCIFVGIFAFSAAKQGTCHDVGHWSHMTMSPPSPQAKHSHSWS